MNVHWEKLLNFVHMLLPSTNKVEMLFSNKNTHKSGFILFTFYSSTSQIEQNQSKSFNFLLLLTNICFSLQYSDTPASLSNGTHLYCSCSITTFIFLQLLALSPHVMIIQSWLTADLGSRVPP